MESGRVEITPGESEQYQRLIAAESWLHQARNRAMSMASRAIRTKTGTELRQVLVGIDNALDIVSEVRVDLFQTPKAETLSRAIDLLYDEAFGLTRETGSKAWLVLHTYPNRLRMDPDLWFVGSEEEFRRAVSESPPEEGEAYRLFEVVQDSHDCDEIAAIEGPPVAQQAEIASELWLALRTHADEQGLDSELWFVESDDEFRTFVTESPPGRGQGYRLFRLTPHSLELEEELVIDGPAFGVADDRIADDQDDDQTNASPNWDDWISMSSDVSDTMSLLELGHDALGDTWIVGGRLDGFRFQGYEGLIYATDNGLEVTWGEKGATYGLPPTDFEIKRDETGLLTRKRKTQA